MATELLYLRDAYLREFTAQVVSASPDGLILDRTAFHPAGGGQPDDSGSLRYRETEVPLSGLRDVGGEILHLIAPGTPLPQAGVEVVGVLDWERRYAFMRAHTMLHILSGVVFRRFRSGITGGQIYDGHARMDFSLDGFGRPLAEELVQAVNEIVSEGRAIEVRFVSREEAGRTPAFVRVATALPTGLETIRLIDITGFDVQADGGTHVRSTAEVGPVTLGKLENKGARNKRLYLNLAPVAPAERSRE